MPTNEITRKSQVLGYFSQYINSISDDLDTVKIMTESQTIEREGKYLLETMEQILKEIIVKRGDRVIVKVHHDCPGCCRAPAESAQFFKFV